MQNNMYEEKQALTVSNTPKQSIYFDKIEQCHKFISQIANKTEFIQDRRETPISNEIREYHDSLESELSGIVDRLQSLASKFI